MSTTICTSVLKCVFDFQTLIAGGLAIGAAVIGAWAVVRTATVPVRAAKAVAIEADRRRLRFFGSVLSQNLSLLRSRCRQAEGTIIVLHGGNHAVTDESRDRMRLETHSSLDDWEFMALLPDGMLRRLIGLQRAIADHNFDVDRAGTFAVDTWRESVIGRLRRISDEANALRGLATMLGRGDVLSAGDVNAPGIADG